MCAKCGNTLESGARFCAECGTPVAIATTHPVSAPPAIVPDPAQQWVAPSPVVTTPPPAEAVPASRRGLFIGIGAAVVAGGAGVAYWRSRPNRLVVDASGSGDYRTIASAILAARQEDTIVLRPGTYKEAVEIDRDVRIVGEGGRSKVIVEAASGEGVFTFTAGSATLTGMTIRYTGPKDPGGGIGAISVQGGKPVIEDCDLTSSAGAAVYISGAGANPVIRNCTMRNSQGPGVNVFDQGQGTIEKCVISGNANAGVQIKTGGNPTVRDCEIRDGKQSGVFVLEQGQGTIEKCVISGNALSGVEIKTGGNPVIRDCEIRDGQEGGVYVHTQGQGMIEKCVISGNALAGVAIKTGGNPTVRNCQINGNKGGGVFVHTQGSGTFMGCTITGVEPWDIQRTAGKVTRTGNTPNA